MPKATGRREPPAATDSASRSCASSVSVLPDSCCATWVSSWASSAWPAPVCGAYASRLKETSRPIVCATDPSLRLSSAACVFGVDPHLADIEAGAGHSTPQPPMPGNSAPGSAWEPAPTAACLAGPPAPPGAAAVCALHPAQPGNRGPTATCLPGPPAPPGAAARQRTDVRPHRALCQGRRTYSSSHSPSRGPAFRYGVTLTSPAARAVRDSRDSPVAPGDAVVRPARATAVDTASVTFRDDEAAWRLRYIEMTALTLVAMLVLYVDHATANVLAATSGPVIPRTARCASTRPSLPT